MAKRHFPLIVALLTVALNIALLSWFLPTIRKITAMQANSTVTLPSRGRELSEGDAPTIRLTLDADGKVYSGGAELSDSALIRVGNAISDRHIVLQVSPRAKYPQVKALLLRLESAGIKNVAF